MYSLRTCIQEWQYLYILKHYKYSASIKIHLQHNNIVISVHLYKTYSVLLSTLTGVTCIVFVFSTKTYIYTMF